MLNPISRLHRLLSNTRSLFVLIVLIISFPACKSSTSPVSKEKYYRLVFGELMEGNGEIFVMNSDGSNKINLTNHPADDGGPVVSPSGDKIVFYSDRNSYHNAIYIMNCDGSKVKKLSANLESPIFPVFTPDGAAVVFRAFDGVAGYYLADTSGSSLTYIPNTSTKDWEPKISLPGDKIAFHSQVGDWMTDIFIINIDGSERTRLTSNNWSRNPEFMPVTGGKILYEYEIDGSNKDLYLMNIDGSDNIQITNRPGIEREAQFSPDGSKIVFQSNHYGQDLYEIFIMNSTGSELIQLTDDLLNNRYPVFSSDGKKIVFLRGDLYPNQIVMIDIDGRNENIVTVEPLWYHSVSFLPLSDGE